MKELTITQAQRWHTDWPSLTLDDAERRLRSLRLLTEFVMCAEDKIPLSWQRFLFSEAGAGEAHVSQLTGGTDEAMRQAA
jgi:hypothetical protein